MNKKKALRLLPFVIAIGLLCLLGVGGWIYFELTGTPWERAAARQYLEAYLQKRFTQEMEIYESGLDFKNPAAGFHYIVTPKGNSNSWFSVRQVERYSPDFIDNYYTSAWETEAQARIQAFLQTIYPVETSASVNIEDDNFSQLPQWGIPPEISFTELRAKVSDYTLRIWVTPDFDKDHPGREYEKIYRVIQFLEESDLMPGDIDYVFGYPEQSSKKDDQTYIAYYFMEDELQAITSVQTMIAILEKHDDGEPTRKVFH